VGLLFRWKPQNVLRWLLNNPEGPDPDEQESNLLVELRGASSSVNAASSILNTIWAVQQADNPALHPAANCGRER
jgi:hypothetical protein